MSQRRHPDMPEPDRPLAEQPPTAITAGDWSASVDIDRRGDVRAAISNAIVALKKRFYGKGPERARTYLNGDYVFCALEGGLTRNEQTLVEAGEEEAVRRYRPLFQKTVTHTVTAAIEQITGRRVIGHHSQVTFKPTRAFEIFVLDGPAAVRPETDRRQAGGDGDGDGDGEARGPDGTE